MANLHEVNWDEIPSPTDDGGAEHLTGLAVASVLLHGTDGRTVDLASIKGRCVVYAFPMTGRPDVPLPDGWNMLPGARGCTPQSCAFRDHSDDLRQKGVGQIFGLSTQSTGYQQEAVERLHLPFPLLSDETRSFASAMRLPTFDVEGKTLLKRLTMIIDNGTIVRVFYPVFPPDRNAQDVLDWLETEAP